MWFFLMYPFKLRMDPSCWVDVRGIEGWEGVWWPIRWNGVSIMSGASTPILASLLVSSLPRIFVCALTLWMAMLWQFIYFNCVDITSY